ncbi:MAG: ROK family protein [Parasporobacterium sp.]|nr:ROK family protein [Parasporobacterium sp.]
MNYRIGVDIGGTTIKTGVIDENYRIVKHCTIKTPDSFEASARAIADMASDLAGQVGCKVEEISAIGIGVPSSVVPETGRLIFANNTGWKDASFKEALAAYLTTPVYVANDANCAIIGEAIAGAAVGRRHVVLVTLGTGVGSGILVDGKLFSGGDGLGAEIGHLQLVFGGITCTCGIQGCFECYASATALIRQTKEAMQKHPDSALCRWAVKNGEINGRTAFECAAEGDETALAVIDQYTSYLAAGLGSITNLFRPELILLGGGVSNAGAPLLERVRSKLSRYILAYDLTGGPVVEKAALGNDAGMIGAAYLDKMM